MVKVALWGGLATILGLIVTLAGIYLYINPKLPAIDSLKRVELQTPLRVYTIDNKLIGEFGEKRRDPIQLAAAPALLVEAILAAEDDAFFHHRGVDLPGLLRASLQLLFSGEIQSGGSTITMQVARNFFLSRERTFSRKFNEILLALKIEQLLSKEEILTLYLNRIYLGNRAYGVKAAAQVYYGKDLDALTLAQLAMIAGLPKAPSTYNPIVNPQRAQLRRDWILKRMFILNKINEDAYQAAVNEPVTARYHGQSIELSAPYVAEIARDKAVELYGEEVAYTSGYRVVTTVDSRLQASAQAALGQGLSDYDQRHGYRGPEARLEVNALLKQNSELNPGSSRQPDANALANTLEMQLADGNIVNLQPWLEVLQSLPGYGKLAAAVVIGIEAQQITVLTTAGIQTLAWENGPATAKPFINENSVGAAPKNPEALFAVGDLIRIYQQPDGLWHLGQVPEIEAALVSLDPGDGSVRSMVGGFNFYRSKFNRVTQARRQPGSNFKPFIYAAALEHGLTAASVFNDAPIVVEDRYLEGAWRPVNASGKFYGPTRLREALYLSRNLISIRLLRTVGIGKALGTLERFGMDADAIPKDLSMALGSHIMSPLEVATAYSVFANGGYKIEPYVIHHIRNRYDEVVYTTRPTVIPEKQPLVFTSHPDTGEIGLQAQSAQQVMDERIVYIINSMLRDVIKRGTGRRARALERDDIAGKTGTTNGPLDAWFSGYNDHTVTTIWVGFDDNKKLGRGEYGGVAALPIWIDYMRDALEGVAETETSQPDGIVTVRVDPETGKRALPSNPKAIFELFLRENAPEVLSTAERLHAENLEQGDNANSATPENLF